MLRGRPGPGWKRDLTFTIQTGGYESLGWAGPCDTHFSDPVSVGPVVQLPIAVEQQQPPPLPPPVELTLLQPSAARAKALRALSGILAPWPGTPAHYPPPVELTLLQPSAARAKAFRALSGIPSSIYFLSPFQTTWFCFLQSFLALTGEVHVLLFLWDGTLPHPLTPPPPLK